MSTATLKKPEKLFLNNTNLLHALATNEPAIGTVREVFFCSQLKACYRLTDPHDGDFEVDDQYIFEVGGKSKTKSQIKGMENAWVVKDDLEYPVGNAIPLWMFGLLY